MRFLVDAQLPPALARYLAAGGQEAEHVADIGLGGAKDQAIWEYAARVGSSSRKMRILLNERFSARADRLWSGSDCRTRESASFCFWFEPILPRFTEALERGERLIEIA